MINIESAGKDRNQLVISILLAVRELGQSSQDMEKSKDLVAYMIIALSTIAQTIDASVGAWEKRGYWVKADRFRMEWGWTQTKSDILYKCLINQDWDGIIQQVVQISQKLSSVKIPARKPAIESWRGAYQHLMSKS
ncbi:MAG: hypothetical protein JW704_08295 [Anaerolineaceae bacterium]|nr:hypothetical protein [Anaerolineaceae bacterium]